MTKLVGHKRCFYRFDNDEAYQDGGDTILRKTRSNLNYLGDTVDFYRDTDIEGTRIKRAISLIQKSGGQLLKHTKDKGSIRQLEALLRKVCSFDNEHYSLGTRSVHHGLLTEGGRALLNGFEFNKYSSPGAVLGDAYHLDLKKGVLCLHGFSSKLLLSKTTNVSRLRVCFLLSQVDFLLGEFMTFYSKTLIFTAKDPVQDILLYVGKRPQMDGVHLAYLWIGFERDDALAIPKLLWRVNDVFRLVVCEKGEMS